MKSSGYFGEKIKHSPLHLCETVEEAIPYINQGFRPDELFEIIGSPMHSLDSPDLLKYYLSLGADPNTGGAHRRATPLHTLENKELVKILLEHGGNPNAINVWGQTPLFCCETVDKVELLLDYGANPNVKDDDDILLLDWWTDDGEGILMKEAVHRYLSKSGVRVNLE